MFQYSMKLHKKDNQPDFKQGIIVKISKLK
jgi:hypothetical protein